MDRESGFVDYYDLLQVDHDCEPRILELAYHYFAKMYHPDNSDTHDASRFHEIVEAYRLLKDPEKRAEYDRSYATEKSESPRSFSLNSDIGIDEETTINDAKIQSNILLRLYKRRRENTSDAGIVGWLLQEKLAVRTPVSNFTSGISNLRAMWK